MINLIYALLLLFPCCVFAQGISTGSEEDDQFVRKAFDRADEFMNTDHYDSAQVYLNKIFSKISYRKPSLFSYFLTSRQAEVYYYNNLHELGMQEALKAEMIANVLKDSILLADAYNFIGLFHLNKNNFELAKNSFKEAIRYVKQPPNPIEYIVLSKPHHIYGNLAETFEKMNLADSAIYYSRISVMKASEIQSVRGMATGNLNLGLAFLLKNEIDSAMVYFESSRQKALEGEDFDVELTAFGGLAACASAQSLRKKAFYFLEEGFLLLAKYPQLNDFYTSIFIESALKVFEKYHADDYLIKTLQLKSSIQEATYNRNNMQIQTLLMTGLENEKTIFNLELQEVRNKQALANIRLYIVLLILLVFVALFIAYRYYAMQRIKLANVRSKISQDLHDEVGATLSGIAMYSYITKGQIKKEEHEEVEKSLDVIRDNADEMISKLNDIVWTVNPVQDNLQALLDRLRDFAIQISAPKQMKLFFETSDELCSLKLPMQQRKNIYLICKEAINNAVKYSAAETLRIKISVENKSFKIEVSDNGQGFDFKEVNAGNGLINMKNRADEIKAHFQIDSQLGCGTMVLLTCKIP